MADINSHLVSRNGLAESEPVDPLIAYVELLFFAYRDFTAEPDAVLAKFDFGRAHHRVLHFVHRRPGLRVADLLDILKITKQSLARVLKELIDQGFIVQRAGAQDRRERLLFPTAKGSVLAAELAALQIERIRGALAQSGPDAAAVVRRFLSGMINGADRARVAEMLSGPAPARKRGHRP
ncbi:MAG: MarR family winged helix-turn-helix transcriptional regulator [Hyphomicrobiaceae bacterium]